MGSGNNEKEVLKNEESTVNQDQNQDSSSSIESKSEGIEPKVDVIELESCDLNENSKCVLDTTKDTTQDINKSDKSSEIEHNFKQSGETHENAEKSSSESLEVKSEETDRCKFDTENMNVQVSDTKINTELDTEIPAYTEQSTSPGTGYSLDSTIELSAVDYK